MLATRLVALALFGLFAATALADNTKNIGARALEKKYIGWERAMAPMGNATGKSKTISGRTYSAYQLGLIDTFSDWIRQSYPPVGTLPQPSRLALPDAVHERPYLPQGTGVILRMWAPSYEDTGKKIVKAQPASAHNIAILTNHLPGMEPAMWFNTPEQHYFTMYYDPLGVLVNPVDQAKTAPYLNEIKASIGDWHLVYFTGSQINVVLTPLTELPIVQVSRAEVLDQGEAAIRRAYAAKKMMDHQLTEYLGQIQTLREKYRDGLDAPATINHVQLGIYSFSKTSDLFERKDPTGYMFPVYRFKPEIYALAKQDKPQWVTVSWPYADAKAKEALKEVHAALMKNFNFGYAYNFFFNPEQVKGKAYAPRDPDYLKTVAARYEQP